VVAHIAKTAPVTSALVKIVPLPATAQGAVIVTVIDPTLPALPPSETPADETICRRPQLLPGTRLAGPAVCKSKSDWTQLKAQGWDVSPDGSLYRTGNYERAHSLSSPLSCPSPTASASSAFTSAKSSCL
jgi:hypothetical protein